MPILKDFDFTCSEEFASHGFLLDIGEREPVLSHVGEILMDEADIVLPTLALVDVPAGSLLGRFGRQYSQTVIERAPVTTEYVFDTEAGYRISCRGVLLPFRGSGETVDHVYGVVSWKSEQIAKFEASALSVPIHE